MTLFGSRNKLMTNFRVFVRSLRNIIVEEMFYLKQVFLLSDQSQSLAHFRSISVCVVIADFFVLLWFCFIVCLFCFFFCTRNLPFSFCRFPQIIRLMYVCIGYKVGRPLYICSEKIVFIVPRNSGRCVSEVRNRIN